MKLFYRFVLGCMLWCLTGWGAIAQTDTSRPVKISVYIPLYLNDAFNGQQYALGKNNIPRHIMPGLEFYNGVMMAVDSFKNEKVPVEINIIDTKQQVSLLNSPLTGSSLDGSDLIIAMLTTQSELKLIGEEAKKRNIPLISATYPNTAGITQNPFFVLLNSSLKTHIEGLYQYMQRHHATNKEIVVFNKEGAVENYIQNLVTVLNSNQHLVPLKLKWVQLNDYFKTEDVLKHLDTLNNNVAFVASPLEDFGLRVVKTIGGDERYQATVVGMPTWDGIRKIDDADNVEIVYSTPFNYTRSSFLESEIARNYRSNFNSRPSDLVFRGYEAVYHFGKLLLKHGGNFVNNLSSHDYRLLTDFDIKPVSTRQAGIPDYLENKKLYFIKKQKGDLLGVY